MLPVARQNAGFACRRCCRRARTLQFIPAHAPLVRLLMPWACRGRPLGRETAVLSRWNQRVLLPTGSRGRTISLGDKNAEIDPAAHPVEDGRGSFHRGRRSNRGNCRSLRRYPCEHEACLISWGDSGTRMIWNVRTLVLCPGRSASPRPPAAGGATEPRFEPWPGPVIDLSRPSGQGAIPDRW